MAGEVGVDAAKLFLSVVGDESMSLRLCLRSRQASAWLSQDGLPVGVPGEAGEWGTVVGSLRWTGFVDTESTGYMLLGCFPCAGTFGGARDGI